MPTTVRVDEKTKRELDRLQGALQAETGGKLTHSEVLSRLLQVGRRHEAELLDAGVAAWRPPTRGQLGKLFSKLSDGGVATDASKIDRSLYEGSAHE